MITVPATIDKYDLDKLAAFKGKANSVSIMLNGEVFAPGEVQFLTFAGRLNKATGLYDGVYRFALCKTDQPTADLDQLPRREQIDGN